MNEFMQNYIKQVDSEFEKGKNSINELKDKFKSTEWVDIKSMIQAANEIWTWESRLKDAMEIHNLILEMKKEA